MAGPIPKTKAQLLVEEYGPLLRNTVSVDALTLHRIIAQARRLLDSAPGESRSALLDMLGHARYRLGHYDEALKWLRALAVEKPQDADVPHNIACCLIELGDNAGALKALGEVTLRRHDN